MNSDKIVQIILAIILPPLAIYLKNGKITQDFWIDLILCFFAWFPGVLFALYLLLR